MKTLVPKALLLLLLANLALTRHPEGSHSLRLLHTLLTRPHLLEPQFIYAVYLDDIHVLRYNSREEPPRMEHCAPWVDPEEPEYWEEMTRSVLRVIDMYDNILKEMLHFYNQSEAAQMWPFTKAKWEGLSHWRALRDLAMQEWLTVGAWTGNHAIQILLACHVLPGGNFSHGQYELLFNGHDYIALNRDLRTWTAVGKAAEMLRQNWEVSGFALSLKTFIEKECMRSILEKLHYGKEILLRTDTPKMHVTCKVRADGKITLRCWALDFYPADITLTWQRDGSNQTLDMEVIETRPAGDGTFQKWAAVVVPSGEEKRYTCHVNHEGLPETITLKWEPPQPSVPIMPIVTGLVLGAVLMGAVVTFLIWRRRTKG